MLMWVIFIGSLILATIIVNTVQQLFMRAMGASGMFYSIRSKLIAIGIVTAVIITFILRTFGIEVPQ